ncbi:hypothetical protein V5O48_002556 [Marasmius crinis-equi]|uniref:Uncharacterized protein n=1 Tax=Marasmius crinis-equi TaxID=585013 RepID=A0ABR3FVB7_9AGAR
MEGKYTIIPCLEGFEDDHARAVLIGLQLWRARQAVYKAMPLLKRDNEKGCLIRLMLFNIGATVILSCGIFYIADALISWPYMAQAGGHPGGVVLLEMQPQASDTH